MMELAFKILTIILTLMYFSWYCIIFSAMFYKRIRSKFINFIEKDLGVHLYEDVIKTLGRLYLFSAIATIVGTVVLGIFSPYLLAMVFIPFQREAFDKHNHCRRRD